MLVARPPSGPRSRHDLRLVRAGRRVASGQAGFLADDGNRARVTQYLADMLRSDGRDVPAALSGGGAPAGWGHSYGEMAEPLISSVVPQEEPAGLLILAFSVHDLRPGRQTAAYLSHLTPGQPAAFAICDQGSAAAFTGLRLAREYAASGAVRRVLLVVAEQAALPYDSPVTLPAQHRVVAMLCSSDGDGSDLAGRSRGGGGPGDVPVTPARLTAVRQHPGIPAAEVPGLATAELAGLTAGRPAALLLSAAAAAAWAGPAPGAGQVQVRVMPPGQPATDAWWGLIGELAAQADLAGRPGLLVVADYDPQLRYLCLAAFETAPCQGEQQ